MKKTIIAKRTIMILLTCLTLLSLMACGASEEKKIQKELAGEWQLISNDGEALDVGWVFNSDGTAYSYVLGQKVSAGVYEIADGKIALTYDDKGNTVYFFYEYDNGELQLKTERVSWWNLQKVHK